MTYRYQEEVIPWKKVDRLIYSESAAVMRQQAVGPRTRTTQECVKEFLYSYDFPILLAAEWGHIERLLKILDNPNTSLARQRLILIILGETHMDKGYSVLVEN